MLYYYRVDLGEENYVAKSNDGKEYFDAIGILLISNFFCNGCLDVF